MKALVSIIGVAVILTLGTFWLRATTWPSPAPEPLPVAAPLSRPKPVPAPSPPTIGVPTTTPSLIIANTPTTVTVTVQISGASPIPGGVNLLRLGASATQTTILGVMHDDGKNGDAVAGDGIYTLQVPFSEPTTGDLNLQVSAAFHTTLRRTNSQAIQLPVFGMLGDTTSGFTVLYPPGLTNTTTSTTPSGLFTLESSPLSVDIGGGGPEDTSSPVPTGFEVSIEADSYSQPTFDINQWFAIEYPNSEVATISPLTIGGQSGFEIELANEVGAGQPLVVVNYKGYIYQVSYSSTFSAGSTADAIGLSAFNSVLRSFSFTK
jgi:hypothetical protein